MRPASNTSTKTAVAVTAIVSRRLMGIKTCEIQLQNTNKLSSLMHHAPAVTTSTQPLHTTYICVQAQPQLSTAIM
jgi:hypothetical protein